MHVDVAPIVRRFFQVWATFIVCLTAGCWEEIHYKPTPADAARHREAQQALADQNAPPSSGAPASYGAPPQSEPPLPSTPIDTSEQAADDFASDLSAKLAGVLPTSAQSAQMPTPPPESPSTADAQSTPTSAPSEATQATSITNEDAAHSSRRIAFLLGSKLSLAALTNDRGDTPEETSKLFSQSRTLAEMLGLSIADLPPIAPPGGPRPNFDRSLDYLFAQGQQLGRAFASRYGNDHAALLELAVKSNILLALYRPQSRAAESLSTAIEQAGGRSGLPVKLWQPLMDAMANGVPADELRQTVYRMHSDTDRYLATPH
jgi:hypothetical protein